MSLRRCPLRGRRVTRLRGLLPLHALPTPHRTAASISALIEPGTLRVTQGHELIQAWVPDQGYAKLFCSACGSALWSRHPKDHDVISIRLGAFDTDPGIRPSYRQFVAFAPAWEPIPDDGLPHYPDRRPASHR
jgi:hypothetical protein